MAGPANQDTWAGAIALMKTLLGLKRTRLAKFALDIFIDTKALE